MYRVSNGFPGHSVLRIGTVDDFRLHETKLRPRIEQFVDERVRWCSGGEKGGITQIPGNYFTGGRAVRRTGLCGVRTPMVEMEADYSSRA